MNAKFPTTDVPSNNAFPALLPTRASRGSVQPAAEPGKPLPVWVYVIFRKNPSSGHDKLSVKESSDGPVFWSRKVVYIFCCSCHFDRHEQEVIKVLEWARGVVERVCLVDKPLDYAFLPDSFFGYLANCLPKLEFVYLRELDLEKVNRATVERLSKHTHLKKLIVHGCRNFEVLQDFHYLPQLLVVKGDIVGLKAMLGDDIPEDDDNGNGRFVRASSKSPQGSTYSGGGQQQLAMAQQNGGGVDLRQSISSSTSAYDA